MSFAAHFYSFIFGNWLKTGSLSSVSPCGAVGLSLSLSCFPPVAEMRWWVFFGPDPTIFCFLVVTFLLFLTICGRLLSRTVRVVFVTEKISVSIWLSSLACALTIVFFLSIIATLRFWRICWTFLTSRLRSKAGTISSRPPLVAGAPLGRAPWPPRPWVAEPPL